MEELGSIDTILDFLQRNGFSRAEAALRSELGSHLDINGFLKHSSDENEVKIELEQENIEKQVVRNQDSSSKQDGESFEELIVKEIECGTTRNGIGRKQQTTVSKGDQNVSGEAVGSDVNFSFSKGSEDTVLDLYSRKFDRDGSFNPCQSSGNFLKLEISDLQKPGKAEHHTATVVDKDKIGSKSAEEMIMMENQRKTCVGTGSTSKTDQDATCHKCGSQQSKDATSYFEHRIDDPRSRTDAASSSFSDQLKGCSVKTVFADVPVYDSFIGFGEKDGERKTEVDDVRAAIKEQVDEVGRSLYLSKLQGICAQNSLSNLGLTLLSDDQKEDLPRLPPVRLKSEDKSVSVNWDNKVDQDGQSLKLNIGDNNYLIGNYLDIPVGQEINSSDLITGGKRIAIANRLVCKSRHCRGCF